MLEFAFVTLLAPLALTQSDLVEDLRVCEAIQDRRARLRCYDTIAFSLGEEEVEPPVVESGEAAAPPSAGEAAPETTGEAAPETTGEAAPESTGEAAPESTGEAAPESTGEAAPESTGEADPESIGGWILGTGTTPSATLLAEENRDRRGGPVRLTVRCQNRRTEVFVDWGEYLNDEQPTVTTRLDSSAPSTYRWTRSSDKLGSVYSPSGTKNAREQRVAEFARQLLYARKLSARVIPRGTSAVTAVFDLSGVAEALRPVREACRW